MWILNIRGQLFYCHVSKELCCLNDTEWGIGTILVISLSEGSPLALKKSQHCAAFQIKIHLRSFNIALVFSFYPILTSTHV